MLRRHLIILVLMLGAVFSVPAFAASTEDARKFVETLAPRVLAVVNASNLPEEQKRQQLQQLFVENVDSEWIGRFVLGHYWPRLTPEQQQRYLDVHRQYLLNRYTSNFADYSGSRYVVTDVRQTGAGEFAVDMNIQSSKENVGAGYKLREADGNFRIYDIIVEGVSLLSTHRSEFTSVAQRQGVDQLIRQLELKTQTASK